eukprot:31332-Pelagococcus_subviridis.AAC.6
MRLSLGEEWGIDDDGGGAGDDDAREREIRIALARTAVGVAGLVTFLIATSPIEEVERVTKRSVAEAVARRPKKIIFAARAPDPEESRRPTRSLTPDTRALEPARPRRRTPPPVDVLPRARARRSSTEQRDRRAIRDGGRTEAPHGRPAEPVRRGERVRARGRGAGFPILPEEPRRDRDLRRDHPVVHVQGDHQRVRACPARSLRSFSPVRSVPFRSARWRRDEMKSSRRDRSSSSSSSSRAFLRFARGASPRRERHRGAPASEASRARDAATSARRRTPLDG